jgi:hypothetical protein
MAAGLVQSSRRASSPKGWCGGALVAHARLLADISSSPLVGHGGDSASDVQPRREAASGRVQLRDDHDIAAMFCRRIAIPHVFLICLAAIQLSSAG